MPATPRRRDAEGPAPGGRARDPKLDDAIAAATKSLLDERGPVALTIEAIARRAGVARATVYRRWPNQDALLLDLLRGLVREFPIPDRGHVRDDLIALLEAQLDLLERDSGRLHPSLAVQARTDPAAGEVLWELVRQRRAALDAVLQRGVARRQIRRDVDTDVALFLLWGPVYYRYIVAALAERKGRIERDFIARLVDSVLVGIGTPRRQRPSRPTL